MLSAREIVDRRLLDHDSIVGSGGDHRHSIRIDPNALVKVASPTLADICMVGHVTAAVTQQIDLAAWPTVKRIFETAMALPEFAKAHPLAQPDTPEAMRPKA